MKVLYFIQMKPPLCPSRMTKKKIRKITESNQVGQACFGLVNLYWLLLTTIMGLKKPSRRMCYTDLPRTEVRLTSLPFLPFWEISMTCFFFFLHGNIQNASFLAMTDRSRLKDDKKASMMSVLLVAHHQSVTRICRCPV